MQQLYAGRPDRPGSHGRPVGRGAAQAHRCWPARDGPAGDGARRSRAVDTRVAAAAAPYQAAEHGAVDRARLSERPLPCQAAEYRAGRSCQAVRVPIAVATAACTVTVLAWAYLAVCHGGYWRTDQRLPAVHCDPAAWPDVTAVVPARDEAAMLPVTMPTLLGQHYPGSLRVVLVDDESSDGTAAMAIAVGGATAGSAAAGSAAAGSAAAGSAAAGSAAAGSA